MADDTERQAEQGTGNDAPNPDTAPAQSAGDTGRTFTQDEVNQAVTKRLERERQKFEKQLAQYADYDEKVKAAQRLQEIEDANKSEMEKAIDRLAKREKEFADLQAQNARLQEEQTRIRLQSAVITEATKQGFIDPSDAWRYVQADALSIDDDGQIKGVDKALATLVGEKPYLLREPPTQGPRPTVAPTNPPRGGRQTETDAERRNRLFGVGGAPFGSHGGGVYWPDEHRGGQ